MHALLFPQCLQSSRSAAAGTTIAIVMVMAFRLPFSKEAVAIAVTSAGLAICTAWHFERSGPDYEFLRRLEALREMQHSPNKEGRPRRNVHTRESSAPLRAHDGYAQR